MSKEAFHIALTQKEYIAALHKNVYGAEVISLDGRSGDALHVLSTNHHRDRQVVRVALPAHVSPEEVRFTVDGEEPENITQKEAEPSVVEFVLTLAAVIAREGEEDLAYEERTTELTKQASNRLRIKPAQVSLAWKRHEARVARQDEEETRALNEEAAADLEVNEIEVYNASLELPTGFGTSPVITFNTLLPFESSDRVQYTFSFRYQRRAGYGEDGTSVIQTKLADETPLQVGVYFDTYRQPFELVIGIKNLDTGERLATSIPSSALQVKAPEVSTPVETLSASA